MTTKCDLPSQVLLTSLFNTMASLQPTTIESRTGPPTSTFTPKPTLPSPNPLRNLPPQSRNIFLTAHCLLPTSFLAALDLLEKSLVVRYTCKTSTSDPTSEDEHEDEDDVPRVYYIRSNPPPPQNLAIPGPNFTAATTVKALPKSAKSYVYEVRPSSWNCTCIAFTLAAYQRHTLLHTQNKGYGLDVEGSGEEMVDLEEMTSGEARLGGDGIEGTGISGQDGQNDRSESDDEASGLESDDETGDSDEGLWYGGTNTMKTDLNGRHNTGKGHTVPVCKHLLAAVLAERCKGLFGRYVVEEVVSADEMVEKAVLWE
ncbi:hypothetical protein TWF694_006938 [Orbilia ellipsospora]|uniref:SWIM-type domain-containing protein n=1 Tax=Orbilia ellipsospora TaxID=2528407 RepID=A0AAV9XQ30_9PEZI